MSTGPTKDVVFLAGVNAPPLTRETQREIGFQLRQLQDGALLSLPISRPMSAIGPRVHELRLSDESGEWRVVYRIDPEEIIVVEVFKKTTQATPNRIIELCQARLTALDLL